MPRTLDTFPAAHGAPKYPWDRYLDGQVWELVPGVDFTAKLNTFVASARQQAKRRGGSLRTRILTRDERQVLVLQFQGS